MIQIFLNFKETLLKSLQKFSEMSRCEILKKYQENYKKKFLNFKKIIWYYFWKYLKIWGKYAKISEY